jgi:signal transduction histidine kinase/PAS domain-containing protein/BarA-like signal transduction histidine kinase
MKETRENSSARSREDARQAALEEMNAALRREVADYDLLMESAGVCIVKVSLDSVFTIQWCNEAAQRIIGYSTDEFEAQFGYDLASYFRGHDAVLTQMREALKKALDQNKPRFDLLTELPTRTGFIRVQGGGIFADPAPQSRKPRGLYIVFSDVSAVVETRRMLDAADQENAWLNRLLDNIPAGVVSCMLEKGEPQTITVNRYLARHLGVAEGKTAAAGVEELLTHVHAEDRGVCSEALTRFLKGESPLDVICRLRTNRPEAFLWMHIEGSRIASPGGSVVAILTCTNIDALKKAEKTLAEAVTTAQLMAWDYDIPTRTITMADNAVTRLDCEKYGFPAVITEVPESLISFIDEDSVPDLLDLYRKVDAGENASCELWFKEDARCERVTYTVERDEKGRPAHGYAVGVDITAEKMMAVRYRRAYERVGNQLATVMGEYHLDLTQNRFLDMHGSDEILEKLRGIDSADGFVATISQRIADPKAREAFDADFTRIRLLEQFREGQIEKTIRYTTKTVDGRLHQRDGYLSMARNPQNGNIEAYIYELDSDTRMDFENIVRAINQGVYGFSLVVDMVTGKIRFGGNMQGDTLEAYHDEDYTRPMTEALRHMMAPEQLQEAIRLHSLDNIREQLANQPFFQITLSTVDGRWLQWRFAYIDEARETVLIQRADITEAMAKEQRQNRKLQDALNAAAKANEDKSAFLAGMSHDMRTPLNGVLSFTNFALRETDPVKREDYLQKIKASGDLLLDLVNDTLDLSRIESGKLRLELQTIPISQCGLAVADALRPAAEEKGVSLITGPFPDKVICVDKGKFQKIWLNLLSNAIKYTPPGGTVRAWVEAIDPPEDGRNRRLIVEDNGIGMSEAFMATMFEPFAQEHRPEAKNIQGTGLGLAILKRYVDFLGGVIRVRSAVGEGTRFEVDISIKTAREYDPLVRQKEVLEAVLEGRRVLVCDDNALNIEIAAMLLKDQKIQVDAVNDGKAAVERFAASPEGSYDAILMDIRMPEMNGYEATRAIRALPRGDADIPVIAMTADAFAEDLQRVQESGMDDYVTKPIVPFKLYQALGRAVGADKGPQKKGEL